MFHEISARLGKDLMEHRILYMTTSSVLSFFPAQQVKEFFKVVGHLQASLAYYVCSVHYMELKFTSF